MRSPVLRALGLSLLWTLPAACDARPPDAPGAPGAPVAREPAPWDPSAATARLSGRVLLRGEPPAPRALDLRGEAPCFAAHDEPPLDDSTRVGPDGGLADVLVRVSEGLEPWRFEPPREPAHLAQAGCLFRPRVLGLRVGQLLRVSNLDPVTHNVRVVATANPSANLAQPAGAPELELRFPRPEVFVAIRCDLHGWMRAEVGVVAHPFFAVTDDRGRFDLGALPPGRYTLRAEHPVQGARDVLVELAGGGSADVLLELEVR